MSKSRTILVTGGARRVGKAIVEDLVAHGHAVAIHYNSASREADELVAALNGNGGHAVAVGCDLTNPDAVSRLVTDAGKALGARVEVLVNNASVFEDDSASDFEWEVWDRHFAVHLKAPAMLARKLAEGLPEGGDGLVVNMIDQRVWRLNPRFFSYTLSKSALWTATRTLAQSLAPSVRVNAIGPGPTLANTRQQDEDFQGQIEAILLERGPDLAEFGATIRWMMDARSLTGQMIALDGGQHLAWETPDVTGIAE